MAVFISQILEGFILTDFVEFYKIKKVNVDLVVKRSRRQKIIM